MCNRIPEHPLVPKSILSIEEKLGDATASPKIDHDLVEASCLLRKG
jgi:hypothetical protein